MLEVYFDDSATTDWITAACYVSSEKQWAAFQRDLKLLAEREGFHVFHMTDLASGWGEFRGWPNSKRKRVYKGVAALIRRHVQHGFALAFQKSEYDACIPEYIKADLGNQYYPVAIDFLLGAFVQWRQKCAKNARVRYIFDQNTKGKNIRTEIQKIEANVRKIPGEIQRLGMSHDGFTERSKRIFSQLQAADLLAWQWSHFMMSETGTDGLGPFYGRWQMKEIFNAIRYDCGWIQARQFRKWVADVYEHEVSNGVSSFLANTNVENIRNL
jgi:hypothetical protein